VPHSKPQGVPSSRGDGFSSFFLPLSSFRFPKPITGSCAEQLERMFAIQVKYFS
jgi:hypothetical protein